MRYFNLLIGISLACAAPGLNAQEPSDPRGGGNQEVEVLVRETFDRWDWNGDGDLNFIEFRDLAVHEWDMNELQASNVFDGLDSNSDGAVSAGEYSAGSCCT